MHPGWMESTFLDILSHTRFRTSFPASFVTHDGSLSPLWANVSDDRAEGGTITYSLIRHSDVYLPWLCLPATEE